MIGNKKYGSICDFTSTRMISKQFIIKGKTNVKCMWDSCNLVPGIYYIKLKVNNYFKLSDSLLRFEITEKDAYGTNMEISGLAESIFLPKGSWEIKN